MVRLYCQRHQRVGDSCYAGEGHGIVPHADFVWTAISASIIQFTAKSQTVGVALTMVVAQRALGLDFSIRHRWQPAYRWVNRFVPAVILFYSILLSTSLCCRVWVSSANCCPCSRAQATIRL